MNEENTSQLCDKLANDEEVRARISLRAYEIYLSRGGELGSEVEDWMQAENEVLASLTEEHLLGATTESTQAATDVGETKE